MNLDNFSIQEPDADVKVKDTFEIDSDLKVKSFSTNNEYVPKLDSDYCFDKATTLSILAGFQNNRRVMVQGLHGSGKSTHIEQVAARLNWPCIRINLDSHISRIDLLGKDVIAIEDSKQITKFQEGILPWAIQNPVALVFDEYDAGRADVMFVIQRVLESGGKLTLLDTNKVISPHNSFRLFATANTVGLGDTTGLYHGTQQINQGQMDRWSIVASLNYLPVDAEVEIILSKVPSWKTENGKKTIQKILEIAEDPSMWITQQEDVVLASEMQSYLMGDPTNFDITKLDDFKKQSDFLKFLKFFNDSYYEAVNLPSIILTDTQAENLIKQLIDQPENIGALILDESNAVYLPADPPVPPHSVVGDDRITNQVYNFNFAGRLAPDVHKIIEDLYTNEASLSTSFASDYASLYSDTVLDQQNYKAQIFGQFLASKLDDKLAEHSIELGQENLNDIKKFLATEGFSALQYAYSTQMFSKMKSSRIQNRGYMKKIWKMRKEKFLS